MHCKHFTCHQCEDSGIDELKARVRDLEKLHEYEYDAAEAAIKQRDCLLIKNEELEHQLIEATLALWHLLRVQALVVSASDNDEYSARIKDAELLVKKLKHYI